MRVWIDLANSPHPLLFAPIARRLETDGHEVLITSRDHAQTIALTRERWPAAEAIGGRSPASPAGKVWALTRRIAGLRRWASAHAPDVALSHNSYAQIVAARSLRIPVVTAMDYEHQPANHLAFRLATRILVPEVFPAAVLRRCGARPRRVRQYQGLKEVLALGDFVPDRSMLSDLGLSEEGSKMLVVARTPPTGALYHRHGNTVFLDALRIASSQPGVQCVVLPRTSDQREPLIRDAPGCLVPEGTVDARSLMHAADLVLGAGGTMTREAALLGIPTLSLFEGKPAAADTWLVEQHRLRRLKTPEDVAAIRPRSGSPVTMSELRTQCESLAGFFANTTVEVGKTGHS
jgi:predicted glycosyltransferase